MKFQKKNIGFGLGLRNKHYNDIINNSPKLDFFEITTENYIHNKNVAFKLLNKVREIYPIFMHGVSLSIGSNVPINHEYIKALKELINIIEPSFVSDHFCWTGINKVNTHDLLPIAYTEKMLAHVKNRVDQVQNQLKCNILLENPSSYLSFANSSMHEADFINEIVQQTGCGLLLDVNNVYVSCYNHALDTKEYIDKLPLDKVGYIHLAGFTDNKNHLIDTHDNYVHNHVWELYKYVIYKAGIINTMVEWDSDIPEFSILEEEINKARTYANLPKKDLEKSVNNLYSGKDNQKTFIEKDYEFLKGKTDIELMNFMQEATLDGITKNITDKYLAKSWIEDSKKDFPIDTRLAVYNNAYFMRLFESIVEDFDIIEHFTNAEQFKILVNCFIREVRSSSYDLQNYSYLFPDYIKNNSKKIYDKSMQKFSNQIDHKFLHKICYYVAEGVKLSYLTSETALTSETVRNLSHEQFLKLNLCPISNLKIEKSIFNIEKIFDDYKNNIKQESHLYKNKKPQFYAIYNVDNNTRYLELTKEEAMMLKKMKDSNVEETLSLLLDEYADNPQYVLDNLNLWFAKLVQNKMLCKDNM